MDFANKNSLFRLPGVVGEVMGLKGDPSYGWEHTIYDDADYAAHVDYIHFNPVKHGLVVGVEDWPC